MSHKKEEVIIRLTKEQASLFWGHVDGWADAGGGEGGNTDEETALLMLVMKQIEDQTRK